MRYVDACVRPHEPHLHLALTPDSTFECWPEFEQEMRTLSGSILGLVFVRDWPNLGYKLEWKCEFQEGADRRLRLSRLSERATDRVAF